MLTVTPKTLTDLGQAVLVAIGAPDDIATLVATSLVRANLLGHDSHGILRLARYVGMAQQGRIVPSARPTVVRQVGSMAVVDGRWGFGQASARLGAQTARDLAAASGIGCVSLTQTAHIGRLGDYMEWLAKEGFIGLIMTSGANKGGAVAPFGGRERVFGTNPLAWAAPVGPGRAPLVVDIATSGVAEGKLAVARAKGETVPPGLVIDAEGLPSNDPNSFYTGGALLPFGGHKGYGLMLMIEIMACVLTGFAPPSSAEFAGFGNPTLIVAWEIDHFVPREQFDRQVAELLSRVETSQPADGFTDVLLPGEPEARMLARRQAEGIPLPEETWEELVTLAQSVGVSVP